MEVFTASVWCEVFALMALIRTNNDHIHLLLKCEDKSFSSGRNIYSSGRRLAAHMRGQARTTRSRIVHGWRMPRSSRDGFYVLSSWLSPAPHFFWKTPSIELVVAIVVIPGIARFDDTDYNTPVSCYFRGLT
eukprot:scaffold424_cov162-Amphora_coffeaeformis.AAC.7